MSWIALEPSNPDMGLITEIPPPVKKLTVIKNDEIPLSGNTENSYHLWYGGAVTF